MSEVPSSSPVVRTTDGAPAVSAEEFASMVRANMGEPFPFTFDVESLERGRARIRMHFDPRQLRPGGTIAGPVLFTLADTVFYALAMGITGDLHVVTSELGLRFLRRPGPVDLVAEGRLLKDRGRLLVGDVLIYSDGDERPVAHATGTYAVPSQAAG